MKFQERWYILDADHHTVEVDMLTWARWLDGDITNRIVDWTGITSDPDCHVSTVFLGLDHNWGAGPPLLFETMIFGGARAGEMWRYSSWDDAATGHRAAVRKARKAAGQKVRS